MATQSVQIPEDAYNQAIIQLSRAQRLAEMQKLYQNVNAECEDLQRNAAEIVEDLVGRALDLMKQGRLA